jgi:hypothetical protein
MATIISVMVRATRYGARRILRLPRDFDSHLICDGYPLAAWRNDPEVVREQKQFFNAIASKVSYLEGLPDLEEQLTSNEYRYGGTPANGLGVASALEGLAVSARFEDRWNHPFLELERNWIELDGDGEVLSDSENVYHASATAHVETHRDWIRARAQSSASDGPEIWHRRNELLPGLVFCACVEKELRTLGPGHVMLKPVYGRLRELDNYARNWEAGPFNPALLPSKVTPESESTIDEHEDELTFACPDGEARLFTWHARMTPGEWRLHFYPDGTARRIIIGRIGRKPFV